MSRIKEIVDRANTDPAFRQRLKSDPKAAIQELGITPPSDRKIEVYEQSSQQFHLFLGQPCGNTELNKILNRAIADPDFKKHLMTDPTQELRSAGLPDGVKVVLHDKSPEALRIVLSDPIKEECELSDSELETVAGGTLRSRIKNFFCRDIEMTVIDAGQGYKATATDKTDGTLANYESEWL